MPAAATLLKSVAKEAATCTLCPLYRNATQTVFGEGAAPAPIMLVGEQPGIRKIWPAIPSSGRPAKFWTAPWRRRGWTARRRISPTR